ncbi:bifunctional helix-turn-helix transcriptional regulator/GNAT family N-acetyltransferase [Microbaculum marinisediminis]|uniref:Helix-turn-helix domain-containing GNAT family N-acetyltransferase n=1 Tax=Microbaculum marinisediminis TaxID=2931392 RepID=A0AAW5R3N1_9HYPH|nr:helix-turn-helix domain-containing GNAT family N-acetyltransferase [Microbaculum sp. A6E488]MCT8974886.1 helix-turn-helix domain-containing GNAT family N-acetyltransferase [Microbaculum sp. A6E488]
MSVSEPETAAVRRFTRFYTRQIGLLNDGLLKSPYSLAESRVLYEIANRDAVTASDLGRELGLDAGYLSRMLRGFQDKGLIARSPSKSDARRQLLRLTEAGRAAFAGLDRSSAEQVEAMLAPLSAGDRKRLVSAMATIERLLGGTERPAEPIVLRPQRPGDMGWVVHRHGVLYAEEYGWDGTFEPMVADIVAAFIRNFDPKRERCWIAERGDDILGSIFLVRESDTVAKLRMLYVEPEARGTGLGRRLVSECLAFARACGYAKVVLWTNDCLDAARRLYQDEGFALVKEEKHHSFGKDLVGQYWELEL